MNCSPSFCGEYRGRAALLITCPTPPVISCSANTQNTHKWMKCWSLVVSLLFFHFGKLRTVSTSLAHHHSVIRNVKLNPPPLRRLSFQLSIQHLTEQTNELQKTNHSHISCPVYCEDTLSLLQDGLEFASTKINGRLSVSFMPWMATISISANQGGFFIAIGDSFEVYPPRNMCVNRLSIQPCLCNSQRRITSLHLDGNHFLLWHFQISLLAYKSELPFVNFLEFHYKKMRLVSTILQYL